ncbi:MAG: Transcriptional regulator, AraC family with acetamidase/formamidase [Xanthobacteraceae bacterium]|jgi:acetamidase/formamidase/AraC-like DNA-binding protein|nr:Transcriptional regulator, AraC family with acetamidase/formamidase [Xanthobacteraceae bacterium]
MAGRPGAAALTEPDARTGKQLASALPADGIPEGTIAVETLPLCGQENAWRRALGELRLESRRTADEPFRFGHVSVKCSASGTRFALLQSTPQPLARRPAKDAASLAPLLIIFHRHGRGRILTGTRASEFADGDLSVCDAGQDWTLDLRADFEIAVLEVPRERLLARLGRARIRLPAVLGASIAAAAARPVMRTLAGNFDALDGADLASAEIALVELVAGALLGEAREPAEDAVTQTQAAHMRRVLAAIEARLAEPTLALADIAAQEGLSPRYLQRLFERQSETFSDYVRLRRLERCRLDLVDPKYADQSIAEIGFRWTFRDQAHFSRAFSAAFGVSPRDVRKAVPRPAGDRQVRGRPLRTVLPQAAVRARKVEEVEARPLHVRPAGDAGRHHLTVSKDVVHWGYMSRNIPPALRVKPEACVTIETLTQHAFDDHERMIKDDPAAEEVFRWTTEGKAVDRRGAGPMNASVLGRGAGEGFGVHICTGPVHIEGAEPGDVLEVEILDIRPRPSGNPDYQGKCFASNAAAWWGYQYWDLFEAPTRREVVTIFELDLDGGATHARPVYSYRWTPQTDPFGVRHETIDYPGIPVDHASVEERHGVMAHVRVPIRPHFGFMGVAPKEADIVDSIPPGYFGGNIDNWRAGRGTTLYLPVAVPGALFSVGDGHLAQGDGEINGTALEASLTGDFRFRLHKKHSAEKPWLKGLGYPLLETPDEWVLQGFSYPNYLRELGQNAQSIVYKKSSLDLAMRSVFRTARKFLIDTYGLDEDEAVALMSIAVDFGVTQVADGNWGVHAIIRKEMFGAR